MENEEKDIYGEIIGCDQLHYAIIASDTEEEWSAGANKYLAPAAEIMIDGTGDLNKRYYDNVVRYVSSGGNEKNITLTVSGVPEKVAAELTGKRYDAETGRIIDTGDTGKAPWCALSGRMSIEGDEYRYFQFLKGKFSLGAQTGASKQGTSITPNTRQLTFTATRTVHEFVVDAEASETSGVIGISGDTTDENFSGANWFAAVQTPPDPEQPSV